MLIIRTGRRREKWKKTRRKRTLRNMKTTMGI